MIAKPLLRFSRLLILLISLGASACASRPSPDVLETVAPASDVSKTVTVYAATTRARSTPISNSYSNGRARQTNFASFDISLPKNHAVGSIEWPKGIPKAETSFAVTRQAVLREDEFKHDVAAGNNAGALIFVHGYNYNYQEALFRLAQMTFDASAKRMPVLFAWPSVASARGYLADKEGATFSRDNLADLIVNLSKGRRKGDVVIFAHSMGAWLTMESLRQISLQGRTDVLSKLHVVLAAPDIDADVFDTQARRMKGKLARPLTVLVSKDDRALRASSFMSTGQPKIGALDVTDGNVLQTAHENNVLFVDISAIDTTGALKHDRYIDLTTLIPKLKLNNGAGGALGKAGALVFKGVDRDSRMPLRVAGTATQP